MSFWLNVGYRFEAPSSIVPHGSVLLSSAMPMHQLERRRINRRYPHLRRRLFDPQLYLAGLDAAESPEHCAKLATYPWFGITGLFPYDSGLQTQKGWTATARARIPTLWLRNPPSDPATLRTSASECIDFQKRLGCESIILPAPLTADPATDFSQELAWLDSALEHARESSASVPLFATVAVSDICLRYSEPETNALLALILDSVSAREIDGVYLVLEQGSEAADGRHCGNVRTLSSILHLTYLFANDCRLRVIVNFLGAFGLACEAVGAEGWASGWYKSLYRFRLADKLAGGRSFPAYWSYNCACDIHLEKDFDVLNEEEAFLDRIADRTEASSGLLLAASRGVRLAAESVVPAWRYSMSNVAAAENHFLLSAINAESLHSSLSEKERMDFVEHWLDEAEEHAKSIRFLLAEREKAEKSYRGKTKTGHVRAWLDAFRSFRRTHRV